MAKDLSSSANGYIPALDGLRALGIIAVVVSHYKQSIIPGGYMGVDMFFVISGFVITQSMISRINNGTSKFFGGFYERRVKRLLPALLFVFSVASIVISFFVRHPSKYIVTGLCSLIGMSNFNLYFSAIGYWSESAALNPFTHTWTLGVEEQFYLVFPLVFWTLTKGAESFKKIAAFLSVVSIISLLGFIENVQSNEMLSYYMIPFRLWEMGIGCLVSVVMKSTDNNFLEPVFKRLPPFLLFLAITVLFFLPFDSTATNLMVVGGLTVLLIIRIVQTLHLEKPPKGLWLITNDISVYIGKLSYSLYLWHWVIMVVARWTIGVDSESILLILLLSIGFAVISYHFVELPLRYSSWKTGKRPGLILLPMTSVVVGSIVFVLFFPADNFLYLGNKTSLRSSLDKYTYQQDSGTEKCSKMRVVGNSHALHIVSMLSVIAEKCDIELKYEPYPNYILIPYGGESDMDRLEEVLSSLDDGDLLILSSKYEYLYEVPYLNASGTEWRDRSKIKDSLGYGLEVWLAELDEVIEQADHRGINVVLFLPNVEFDSKVMNPELCTSEWFRKPDENCHVTVSRDYLDSRFSPEYFEAVKNREDEKANFFLFDPMPIYCPNEDECSNEINGTVLFIDTNHMTPEGSYLMLEAFYKFLITNHLI